MFARRLALLVLEADTERPVPKAWLDQFFMRSFTGHSAFDHVLPVADGLVEAGFEVDPELARQSLDQWLRGRKTISSDARVVLRETAGNEHAGA
jgi:hypothetical protein